MLDINEVKVGDKLVYNAGGSCHRAICTVTGFMPNYPGIRFVTDDGYESHCYVNSFKPYVQPQQTKEQQMISMDKTYRTRDGRKVRVLCVDFKNNGYPVLAAVHRPSDYEVTILFTEHGKEFQEGNGPNALVEYNPASELKMDQAIWVRNSTENRWVPRHFRCIASTGQVQCWQEGRTSHSALYAEDVSPWWYWSATKPE